MPKRILYIAAGIIILLLLVETGLRISDYFSQSKITSLEAKIDKEEITILAVGDSFTNGVGANKDFDYPSILQRIFDAFGKKKYEVVNFGVEDANSTQILNELPDKINEIKPDIVLLLIGGANNWNFSGYSIASSGFLSNIRIFKLFESSDKSNSDKSSEENSKAELSSSDIEKWIKSDIDDIISLCGKNDIRLIIHNYPLRGTDENKYSKAYQLANGVISSVVKEYSIPFVDHNESFSKLGTQKDGLFEPLGGYDYCNDNGYDLIARKIFSKVLQIAGEKPVELPTAAVDKEVIGSELEKISIEIDSNPDSVELYQKRAELYMLENNLSKATEDLDKVIASNPSSVDAYNKRGTIRAQQRQLDLALQDYTKAIELDPKSGFAYSNRGHVYMDLGQNDKAIADFNKSLVIDSKNFDSYNNRGYLQLQLGNYKAAISDFNKIIQMNPEHPFSYNNRGFAKYKMNDFNGAMDDINKSIELLSDNSYAFKNRALIYIAQGKTQNACDDLQSAKKLGFTESFGPEVDQLIEKHCK